MARPQKEGMEYFPHDTDARNDMKIRKLRAVFGNDGYAAYFILLENIYRNKHYNIDISDAETMLILSEECKISNQKLDEIILKCLDLDLFSKEEYELNKILTSDSIKKRTEPIENKRKRNKESYNSSKKEVSEAEIESKTIISDAEIMSESAQSKGKKSKGKESKILYGDSVKLTEKEHEKLLTEYGETKVKRMIEVLDNYKVANGKKYQSDYRAILNWVVERVSKEIKTEVKPIETRANAGAYKYV